MRIGSRGRGGVTLALVGVVAMLGGCAQEGKPAPSSAPVGVSGIPSAAAIPTGPASAEALDPAMVAAIAALPDRSPRGLCDLVERESAAGNAAAWQMVGDCYALGLGGRPRDGARAVRAYQRAADGGRATAFCAMGNLMIYGEIVPQDTRRGIALCRRAAEAGSANAQTDLGQHYVAARGVPRDLAEARRWFARAAGQGHANAQFNLGVMFMSGEGGPQDAAEGERLLAASARGGHRAAPFLLSQAASRRVAAGAAPRSGGGAAVDSAGLLDVVFWSGLAAEVDPDPTRRAQSARLVETLRPALAGVPDLGARLEDRRRIYLGR